jgi:hypothetical protein
VLLRLPPFLQRQPFCTPVPPVACGHGCCPRQGECHENGASICWCHPWCTATEPLMQISCARGDGGWHAPSEGAEMLQDFTIKQIVPHLKLNTQTISRNGMGHRPVNTSSTRPPAHPLR